MPRIRVLNGPQKGQLFLLLPPGPYRFGRDLEADFPLFDQKASRSHFQIEFEDEGYVIRDLDSRSGTLIDDRPGKCETVLPTSRIKAGKTQLRLEPFHELDPLVGRELGGYRILEKVGEGGMGSVYRALQKSLGRIVALKVLAPAIAADPDRASQFIREARAAGDLSHPSLVRVYDVNHVDGFLFYSMEFMARGSVLDALRRSGPLPLTKALEVAIAAATALEYAQGLDIIHRDLKPDNLLVCAAERVKLGDLGLAARLDQSSGADDANAVCGSPSYMAPEQALGRRVDARADLYGLGGSLYGLIAGHPPFWNLPVRELLLAKLRDDPPPLRSQRANVPKGLEDLVHQLLQREPENRPNSASEVLRNLEQLRDAMGTAREIRAPVGSSSSFVIAISLLLLALGGVLGYMAVSWLLEASS